ncbi:Oidioi.mRNA.OKI2018_I69.chr1.g1896.t1.cds [Oikopleura dioica]|uniref:Oidioi.mRNA.OKI2018_I69.chr1.g1896.t1.cds n=1 Tax=Oikopleura dioica TaxID=34765 RepID=A0ABN7SPC7_OIKDI|nr:Oidioi.mRNA.OKI2018_I69.chr1.g1896.t1.cds [Oikopleura dioica]
MRIFILFGQLLTVFSFNKVTEDNELFNKAKYDIYKSLGIGSQNWTNHVKLVNNGYEGLYIAISDKVPEDWSLVGKLAHLIRIFSKILYEKTQKHLYLRHVSIVIPETWNPLQQRPASYETNYLRYENAAREIWVKNWNTTWDRRMYKSAPNFENTPMRVYFSDEQDPSSPRAVKGTPCGEAGRYIHMSSSFFTKNDQLFGDTKKLSVQQKLTFESSNFFFEWAKFKWGVFDSVQPQVCKKFKEEKVRKDGSKCYDTNEEDCFILGIEEKSQQCQHCNDRTVEDVLLEHPDFTGLVSPSSLEVNDAIPDIDLFFRPPRRIVLCLDASTSMLEGNRLSMVRNAVRQFIYTVSSGTYVGIISFNRMSTRRQDLIEIVDEDERAFLVSRLPKDESVASGTSIGKAILRGINMLQQSGPEYLRTMDGGEILLLSDGLEWNTPSVEETMELVQLSGVTVNTISLGNSDTNVLDYLALATKGTPSYSLVQPEESLVALTDAFYSQLGTSEGEAIPIQNQQFTMEPNAIKYLPFVIDPSIGKNTFIQFHFGSKHSNSKILVKPKIELIFPNGEIYDKTSNRARGGKVVFSTEAENNLRISLPGLIEFGRFNLKIDTSGSSEEVSIFVSISSFARKPYEYPIQMNSYVMQPKQKTELYVFAEIQQGQYPVVDAYVWVEIYRPAGSGIETFRIELLRLYDDGLYGDLNANDGIYTAIYSEFLSQVETNPETDNNSQGKYKMRFFATSVHPFDKSTQSQIVARVNRKGFIGGNSTQEGINFINSRGKRSTGEEDHDDPRNFPRAGRSWAINRGSYIQRERLTRTHWLNMGLGTQRLWDRATVMETSDIWERIATITAAPRGFKGICEGEDFFPVMNRCYKVVDTDPTPRVVLANMSCKAEDATLMKADQVDEIMLAFKVTKEIQQSIWIDGYDQNALETAKEKFFRTKEKTPNRHVRNQLSYQPSLSDLRNMSTEAYNNWHKGGGHPEQCHWMTVAPPGKLSQIVNSTNKVQCVTSEESHAYICEKAGRDVSPPEPIRELSVRRYREQAIIGFKEPHDQGRRVSKYEIRLFASHPRDTKLSNFAYGYVVPEFDPLFTSSKDLLPVKIEQEKSVSLDLSTLKDAPPYFIGNIEVHIDVKETRTYGKDALIHDLKRFFTNLSKQYRLGSYITRLHVSASKMLKDGNDWSEVFSDLSSNVRIFGDASFRDPSIYPLIRIFITNSDLTLFTSQNFGAIAGQTSELIFLSLNTDAEDYELTTNQTIVPVIEQEPSAEVAPTLIRKNDEEKVVKFTIIKCPEMPEWGRERNTVFWEHLKAKANEHTLKEIIWQFSITSYDHEGNMADHSPLRIIDVTGRERREVQVIQEKKNNYNPTAAPPHININSKLIQTPEVEVNAYPTKPTPADDTNYTAIGMITGGLIGAAAIGTVLAIMQRGKKTVDEQMSKRKKSKRKKSKKKKPARRQASILDLANYM